MPVHRVQRSSLDELVRYAEGERKRIESEATWPAWSSGQQPGPSTAASNEHAGFEFLTDSRGIKVRVARRGDPLPKLACVFIIND